MLQHSRSSSAAGPAPGINGVIAAATIEALQNGLRVIGLYDGYRHIAGGDASQYIELTRDDAGAHALERRLVLAHVAHEPGSRPGDARPLD